MDVQDGRAGRNAQLLVDTARANGWNVEYLPVGSVKMFNPARGVQDCCFRFQRDNAVIVGATLIGHKSGSQHPDAFYLYNGDTQEPVLLGYLYQQLGTLEGPSDANGCATPVPPRNGHLRRAPGMVTGSDPRSSDDRRR